jgi:DNA-binding response OmpR family regulator
MPARILIVDDDLQSLKLVGLMLQRRGYTIVAARGGEQGLAKAESDAPDLILLDVMMPDLDGLEVCRRLRSQPTTCHIPVIMFTAKSQVGDKVNGFQSGADDYLTKPIHPNDLAARVDAALQRSAQKRLNVPPASIAQVIGFLGVRGGVGTTTLALNAAAALANADGERHVILVDLQASAANAAAQLGLNAVDGLTALVNLEPNDITPAAIGPRLVQHASGLQLLLVNADQPAPAAALTTPQLTTLIGSVSQLAHVVVLDLGSTLDDLTLTALGMCRRIVLALEPQRIAVVAAQNLSAQLERRGIPAARLSVALINRAPGATMLDRRVIEDQLKLPIEVLLPPITEVASQAADEASLIIHIQPGGLYAGQIRTLVQHLTT